MQINTRFLNEKIKFITEFNYCSFSLKSLKITIRADAFVFPIDWDLSIAKAFHSLPGNSVLLKTIV